MDRMKLRFFILPILYILFDKVCFVLHMGTVS
jgi:hypothetical protein